MLSSGACTGVQEAGDGGAQSCGAYESPELPNTTRTVTIERNLRVRVRVLLIDNTVRVSFHKLVRFNDADTDYVYIRGGTWMRESTLDPMANANNHVHIHDPTVYLLSPSPVAFGAANNPGNATSQWHALDESVVSDAYLTEHAGDCMPGADCDYGVGSHAYSYDPALAFPTDPWRVLPGLLEDEPDLLPIEP